MNTSTTSKLDAPAPIRSKDGLGDIVASKTQFVIQNRLKAAGEWGDYSYRKTAEDAIEAARREAKWDDDHELNSYEYRAVIRITSDHVLSPNDKLTHGGESEIKL